MKYRIHRHLDLMRPALIPRHAASALIVSAALYAFVGCNSLMSTAPQPNTLQSVTVQPAASTVQVGGVDMITATQQGSPTTGGQWTVAGTSNGSIDATGLYHAPTSLPSPSLVTINYLYGSQTYNATVTVINPESPEISVQASQPTVQIQGADLFVATQQGAPATGGQWVVLGGSSNGSIDATGLYHAPTSLPTPSVVTINYIFEGQTYSAAVIVTTPVSAGISVQASQPTVQIQGADLFVATQQGAPATGGQWVVLGGSSNGSIDATGNYLAPSAIPNPSTISVGYVSGNNISLATVNIVDAIPTISSVSPAQLTSLTTTIQVVGSGFLPGAIISIGTIPVATTYIDNSHLSATVVLNSPLSATLQITVANPGSGLSQSAPYAIQAIFPTINIQPATLVGGPITLIISGSNFAAGDVVSLNGIPLITTINSANSITATGFLTPWTTGSVTVEVAAGDGTQPIAAQSIPIQTSPVTYDAAARFAMQAGLGPRPDVVQSIQALGFDAWITQQFQQPTLAFTPTSGGMTQFIHAAVGGNSLLRQRLSLALQSFIVPQEQDFIPSAYNFEETLERDCSGNFRQLLTDVASDPNIASFLNLANNQASTNPLVQPNQNFARELMQLFTLGPFLLNDDGSYQTDSSGNPIPTYTQNTVIDLTRALTGWVYPTPVNLAETMWGIDFSQPLIANDSNHDSNAKLIFGTVILPAGQGAVQDRQMALDAIFNHPNLPPFISHLLIQRLVKSDPSPAYIQRISAVFENNGSGVRGDLTAVVRAILLDPEARAGDTTPTPSDGFLQDPFMWQLSIMSALNNYGSDDQIVYLAKAFGENVWNASTVFGFYSPAYTIPGTSIISPEFQLLNNLSIVRESQVLWGIISSQQPGFTNNYVPSSWLFQNFTTVPAMVDALNHLLYHGQMPEAEQAEIINYCSQLNPFDTQFQLETAVFLALNADSFNVSH